jgi:hypothetical protein
MTFDHSFENLVTLNVLLGHPGHTTIQPLRVTGSRAMMAPSLSAANASASS